VSPDRKPYFQIFSFFKLFPAFLPNKKIIKEREKKKSIQPSEIGTNQPNCSSKACFPN
jgi:hypothetical protein